MDNRYIGELIDINGKDVIPFYLKTKALTIFELRK